MRTFVPTPDHAALIPSGILSGESAAETAAMKQLAGAAEAFLRGFRWCGGILESYAGIVIPGVVGVFLHRIRPAAPDVDDWLWTVVGDLPPAYIVTDQARNPAEALEAYIGEMQTWSEAVRLGQPTSDLIPVNAEPTQEYAALLEARLRLLEAYLEEEDGELS